MNNTIEQQESREGQRQETQQDEGRIRRDKIGHRRLRKESRIERAGRSRYNKVGRGKRIKGTKNIERE